MSQNAMTFFELIISSMWHLMTAWQLPGLGFTPAQLFAFLMIFPLVVNFVYSLLSGAVSTNVRGDRKQRASDE